MRIEIKMNVDVSSFSVELVPTECTRLGNILSLALQRACESASPTSEDVWSSDGLLIGALTLEIE